MENTHSAEISIRKITQRIIECLEGESYIHARAALKAAEGKLEQHTLVTKRNLIPQLNDDFYYKEVPPRKYSLRWWWYFIILPIIIAFSMSCLISIIKLLTRQ